MPLFGKKPAPPDLSGKTREELMFLADTADDPAAVRLALLKAEEMDPADTEVQRRLILQGRLHERDPKRPDMSVIKSYLLHAFEHPEDHPPEQERAMARELFDDERLVRAMGLSPDPQAFLRRVLEDLSREYIRIFLLGDSRHVPKVFGISFRHSAEKYIARPARDVIANIFSSPYLSETESRTLARAFYRAFHEESRGDTKELDLQLGPQLRAQLSAE
ncbi:MAG TPA: hypothetical protein VLA21_09205 [Candidatus Limnocylindria bacterium]|nr:hypothetical protein [Candidatus Limnocylindria bacterium]